MTKVQFNSLRNDTQNFLEKSTMEVLGLKAGVGQSIIDNVLSGNLAAIEDKYLLKIHAVVKSDYTKGMYRTADCQAFLKATDQAIQHKLMIGLTGDTGAGKSYMAQAVAKKENVLYYNVHLKKSGRVFFTDLLANMRVPFSGNLSELIDKVAEDMNRREVLLIVDEADKMHRDIRSALHTLRDRTAQCCGILLVGMPGLKNELLRGKEAGKPGYAEFWRRVNIWHHLDGLQVSEINKVLADNGITEPETVREFRQYKSFGELVNAIQLFKILNN